MKSLQVQIKILRWSLLTGLLIFFIAVSYAFNKDKKNTKTEEPGQNNSGQNIFVTWFPTADIVEFELFSQQMARLKNYGRVDVGINSAAEKADFELPGDYADWHEYASYNRGVSVYFPDERISPHIPADFVNKNLDLLHSKLDIIRNKGLSAAFRCNEPRYLPEAFFEQHPHLRGPRVDHPRRSIRKEFAPCFHQYETVEIYSNMVTRLFEFAPEIHTFYFSMNDAGSGTCWSSWLYPGPNGPAFCKNIPVSESVVTMLNIYRKGAEQTGHDVDIFFHGMFTDEERDEIAAVLPARCFLRGRNYPPVKNISGLTGTTYPVKGIINPVGILTTLNRGGLKNGQHFELNFRSAYDRGHERVETIEKLIDIMVWQLDNPAGEGDKNISKALHELCIRWAGEQYADSLYKSFIALNEAFGYNSESASPLNTLYWGVSTRHITRPLVFNPLNLSRGEEYYFLPHVFNVSTDEARNDYIDIHGANRSLTEGVTEKFLEMLEKAWLPLKTIEKAPEQEFINNLSISLRIYASVVRSCNNFYLAQEIRNRHKDILAGPEHRPNKIPTWTGDQDLPEFNAIMRDELDNTLELTDLLENGGMELICYAKEPFEEDTFILGGDLISQLKKKRKIMLDHWTDIEGYLTTPFK